MGLPGAGKGTQAHKLAEMKQVPHISTGDMFRTAIKEETELGLEVKSIISEGKLVPDEVTIRAIEQYFENAGHLTGFILDGFPRTISQANALDQLLTNLQRRLDLVIYIHVEEDELVKRLTGRRICQCCGTNYHLTFLPPEQPGLCRCGGTLLQREDDSEETVVKRLQGNREQTKQLLTYYESKGVLQTVDGSKSMDEVSSLIMELMQVNQA